MPDQEETMAWLEQQEATLKADLVSWEAIRGALDERIRADTRALFREVLVPITQADTLEEAKAAGQHAIDVLAAPGPADSAAKRIHVNTRRAGTEAHQILNRHLNETERFREEFE